MIKASCVIAGEFNNPPPPEMIATMDTAKLLEGAGLVRYSTAPSGYYDLLPFGKLFQNTLLNALSSKARIEGFQEVELVPVQSAALFKKSGRYDIFKDDWMYLQAGSSEHFLSPAHEEHCLNLFAKLGLKSSRASPITLFTADRLFRSQRHRSKGGLSWTTSAAGFMIYSVAAEKRELDEALAKVDRLFVGVFELLNISIVPFLRRTGFVDYVTESPYGREKLARCPDGHVSDRGSMRCSICGKETREFRALSMCMHFVVGPQMANALDYAQWSDSGKIHPWLGTAGLGLGRTLMQTVHAHRTDDGLRWPRGFEPIEIAVIPSSKKLHQISEDVARGLTGLGYRVMLEDRKLSSKHARSLGFLGIPEKLVLDKAGAQILTKVTVNGMQIFEGDLQVALGRYRALAVERLSAAVPMPPVNHAEAFRV